MAILKIVNNHSKSHSSLKKILNYFLKEEKTAASISYVCGDYFASEITPQTVYDEFVRIKQLFGKENGRMYQHGVISWHKDEVITPEMALSFGKEFVSRQYPEYQALVSVHVDREHIHLHFVVNTVSFIDGKMLHWKKTDLKAAKDLSDQLCVNYGLTITKKGKHFNQSDLSDGDITAWDKDTYAMVKTQGKDAYLTDCFSAFEQSMENAGSQEAFRALMKERGWDVIWEPSRKHITFVNNDGKKVRDTKLSSLFHVVINKESLEQKLPSKTIEKPIERRKHRHR